MDKKFINSKEAKELLGNISTQTFWRLRKKYKIKPAKGSYLYLINDIKSIGNNNNRVIPD